ncbi:MAG: DUF1877 family protein [Lacisediminihabitans sp.]
MGIRYYAYPITADEYPLALENPCAFHGSDPLMDAWGPEDMKPEMLYLDKCWKELQTLLAPVPRQPNRPALQLVDGQVTHTETGWIAYERALGPAQVAAIAADLKTVSELDIRRMLPRFRSPHADNEEYEYVAQYLADAQRFTTDLADSGRGLVYIIG